MTVLTTTWSGCPSTLRPDTRSVRSLHRLVRPGSSCLTLPRYVGSGCWGPWESFGYTHCVRCVRLLAGERHVGKSLSAK